MKPILDPKDLLHPEFREGILEIIETNTDLDHEEMREVFTDILEQIVRQREQAMGLAHGTVGRGEIRRVFASEDSPANPKPGSSDPY